MAERIQLNEQDLEDVNGGNFLFQTHLNEDGTEYLTCTVDDANGKVYGTFNCSAAAKRQLVMFVQKNKLPDVPESVPVVLQYALDNNLFW